MDMTNLTIYNNDLAIISSSIGKELKLNKRRFTIAQLQEIQEFIDECSKGEYESGYETGYNDAETEFEDVPRIDDRKDAICY